MTMTPAEFRRACRAGVQRGPSAGIAPGFVQANLMMVPRDWSDEFLLFCQRNPKPCPLVEVLPAGAVEPRCAPGADLRYDLPGYRVFREGQLVAEPHQLEDYWQADLVSFLIGCSFSFEAALVAQGIPLKHLQAGLNVAMYRTSIACQPAGRLFGPMVVSMRPIARHQVDRVVSICARFPHAHGTPLQIGRPEALGIADLARPDDGDAVDVAADEVPVFWACGVTPQSIARACAMPFCITHAPGKMLVTDTLIEADPDVLSSE